MIPKYLPMTEQFRMIQASFIYIIIRKNPLKKKEKKTRYSQSKTRFKTLNNPTLD